MDFDHRILDQFLSRILELHKADLISETEAVGVLAEAFSQAQNDEPTLNHYMKREIERVWKGRK